jgi:hypothetical protein
MEFLENAKNFIMGSKPSSNEELTKLSLSEELTKPPPNVEATSTKPNSSDGQLSDDFSEMDLAPTRRRATSMELLQVLQMQQGTVYDGIVCDMVIMIVFIYYFAMKIM